MKRLLAAAMFGVLSQPTNMLAADCPIPIPDKLSGEEYIACSKTFQAQIGELRAQLAKMSGAFPPGVVMTFDTEDCPPGWSDFREAEGRFLVGIGNNDGRNLDNAGKPLTARPLRKTGGEEAHTLTVAEMPSHTHTHLLAKRVKRANGDYGSAENPGTTSVTEATGGGQPHSNIPPFIALRYCKKM